MMKPNSSNTTTHHLKPLIVLSLLLGFILFIPVKIFSQEKPDNEYKLILDKYKVAYNSGTYADALLYANQMLKLSAEKQDTFNVFRNRLRIADVYRANQNYTASQNELKEILTHANQMQYTKASFYIYTQIASLEIELNQTDAALENLSLAEKYKNHIEDSSRLAYYALIKGVALSQKQKDREALIFFESAIPIYEKISPEDIPNIYNNMSQTYSNLHDYKNALEYAEKSLALSERLRIKSYISQAKAALFSAYGAKGDYKSAFHYYKIFHSYIVDTLLKSQNDEVINELRVKYEADKKEFENEKLKAEVDHQRILTLSFIIIVILLIILLSVLFVSNKNKTKAKELLLKQKQQIESYNEELVNLNKEISENEKRLDNLNQIKDRWFSIVTHDIRSPISTLITTLNNIDLLEPDELKQMVPQIQNQVQTMFAMIENLLQWAYNQMKGIESKPNNFDILRIIHDNTTLLSYTSSNKQIKLTHTSNKSIMVFADFNMIDLVVRNLLINAIKFSHKGNSIEMETNTDENFCYVHIIDHGVGLDENEINQLFQSNMIESKTGTADEKGVGLGLLLCSTFIKSNNGTIVVTSKKNIETRFTFSIPLAK